MFKLNFEKINYEKLGKFTSFLMERDLKTMAVSSTICSVILMMPAFLLDGVTIEKYFYIIIFLPFTIGGILVFLYIRGFKAKRDKAEIIITDNVIAITIFGYKVLSTPIEKIKVKFFHVAYGHQMAPVNSVAVQINFIDYAQHKIMIGVDKPKDNATLKWKSSYKSRLAQLYSTKVAKISEDKFIELAEVLNIKENLEILS